MPHLFYFVRHGQTIWNVENKICGSTDIALTPLGHEQAIAAGKLILERQYPIDAILYSPLMRAADTAKHIAEVTGLPAFAEPRLRSRISASMNPLHGMEQPFSRQKTQFANHYEGGESMLQLAQRIYNLLDELLQQEKNYLLVAHNGIARVVRSYFQDMTNEAYAKYGIGNCEVLQLV